MLVSEDPEVVFKGVGHWFSKVPDGGSQRCWMVVLKGAGWWFSAEPDLVFQKGWILFLVFQAHGFFMDNVGPDKRGTINSYIY
jgi:hypothetical protein